MCVQQVKDKMWQKYFICFFLAIITASKCEERCTKSLFAHENYLATKTPYRVVANTNDSEINYEGCKATKLWGLIRHGTRNPNAQLIEKMRTRLDDIREQILDNLPEATEEITNSDLDLFRTWKVKLQDKDDKKLTHEGEDEMLLLAERLQKRFPDVLSGFYSESAYDFKFTATQRTKRSAYYFASGLFGRNVARNIDFPDPLKRDPILRFYKLCNKWRREVSKNPEAIAERKKFENGELMSRTIEDINNRLGFADDDLDFSDIHAMYMACAFETAWNKRKKSPWCSPFTTNDLKVLEYAEDLKYYWVDGYGHELTYKQACPAFNHLIDFFQNENDFPRATLYFTHSGTLLKMLAHMELFKEKEHLTADDFDKNSNRNWRVSQIDPFGTNLIFVLFDCESQQKVLTLHQENIVHLPSCPNSDLCDLQEIIKYYNSSIECSFDEMCENA